MKVVKILKENDSFMIHDVYNALFIVGNRKIYFIKNNFLHHIHGPAYMDILNLKKHYYYNGYWQSSISENKVWKKVARNLKREDRLKVFK